MRYVSVARPGPCGAETLDGEWLTTATRSATRRLPGLPEPGGERPKDAADSSGDRQTSNSIGQHQHAAYCPPTVSRPPARSCPSSIRSLVPAPPRSPRRLRWHCRRLWRTRIRHRPHRSRSRDAACQACSPAGLAETRRAAIRAEAQLAAVSQARRQQPPPKQPKEATAAPASDTADKTGDAGPRPQKRRAAAPPRSRIAANDDAPSIGGLIFALQQKPSNRPFMLAAAGSGGWLAVGGLLAWAMLAPRDLAQRLLRCARQPDHDHRGGDHLPADRPVLVPGAARVAGAGAEAHVLGHDRGRGAPCRARPERPSSPQPPSARRCAARSRS